MSCVKVHIRFNQSAYATKLLVFLEHFYADLTWLMPAGIEQEFLQLFPPGGSALLEDLGKDIYGQKKKRKKKSCNCVVPEGREEI